MANINEIRALVDNITKLVSQIEFLNEKIEKLSGAFTVTTNSAALFTGVLSSFEGVTAPFKNYTTELYNLSRSLGIASQELKKFESGFHSLSKTTAWAQHELVNIYSEISRTTTTFGVSFREMGNTLRLVTQEFGNRATEVHAHMQRLASQSSEFADIYYGRRTARGLTRTQRLLEALSAGGFDTATAIARLEERRAGAVAESIDDYNRFSQTDMRLRREKQRVAFGYGRIGAETTRYVGEGMSRVYGFFGDYPALAYGAGVAGTLGGLLAGGGGGLGGEPGVGPAGGAVGGGGMSAGVVNITANVVNLSGGAGGGGGGLGGLLGNVAGGVAGGAAAGALLGGGGAAAGGVAAGIASGPVGWALLAIVGTILAAPFIVNKVREWLKDRKEDQKTPEQKTKEFVDQWFEKQDRLFLKFMDALGEKVDRLTTSLSRWAEVFTGEARLARTRGIAEEVVRGYQASAYSQAQMEARIRTQAYEEALARFMQHEALRGRELTREQAEQEFLATDIGRRYKMSAIEAETKAVQLLIDSLGSVFIRGATTYRKAVAETTQQIAESLGDAAESIYTLQSATARAAMQAAIDADATYKNVEELYRQGFVGVEQLTKARRDLAAATAEANRAVSEQFKNTRSTLLDLVGTQLQVRGTMFEAFGATAEQRRGLNVLGALQGLSRMGYILGRISEFSPLIGQRFSDVVSIRFRGARGQWGPLAGDLESEGPEGQALGVAARGGMAGLWDKAKDVFSKFGGLFSAGGAVYQFFSGGGGVGGGGSLTAALPGAAPARPVTAEDIQRGIQQRIQMYRREAEAENTFRHVQDEISKRGYFTLKVGAEAIQSVLQDLAKAFQEFASNMKELYQNIQTTTSSLSMSHLEFQKKMAQYSFLPAQTQFQLLMRELGNATARASDSLRNYQVALRDSGNVHTDMVLKLREQAMDSLAEVRRIQFEMAGGFQGMLEAELEAFNKIPSHLAEVLPRAAEIAAKNIPSEAKPQMLYGRYMQEGEQPPEAFHRTLEFVKGMHPLAENEAYMPWWMRGFRGLRPGEFLMPVGRQLLSDPNAMREYRAMAAQAARDAQAGGQALGQDALMRFTEAVGSQQERALRVVLVGFRGSNQPNTVFNQNYYNAF